MISEKKWKELSLGEHFLELSDDLLKRIWFECRCSIDSVFMISVKIILLKI